MTFTKGDPNINRKGRIDGGFSLAGILKRKLKEAPKGLDKRIYAQQIIDNLMDMAIKQKDYNTIKLIFNYVDGLPKQNIEFEGEVKYTEYEHLNDEQLYEEYQKRFNKGGDGGNAKAE